MLQKQTPVEEVAYVLLRIQIMEICWVGHEATISFQSTEIILSVIIALSDNLPTDWVQFSQLKLHIFFPVDINDPTSGSLRNATILIRMGEVLVQETANPRLTAGRMASVKTPISLI